MGWSRFAQVVCGRKHSEGRARIGETATRLPTEDLDEDVQEGKRHDGVGVGNQKMKGDGSAQIETWNPLSKSSQYRRYRAKWSSRRSTFSVGSAQARH